MAEKILRTEYSEEMQKSYLDYSMSVITSRAIPDSRDGLKPVQRRVLYDMNELRLTHDKPHRKSARIVGDTMGKYHPHGDSSIYETLVVMSQGFKKSMPLVDGHGNFGSIEGDGAAAMRYTEAKLEAFAEDVFLKDLDKTVAFVPNYDETEKEPEVLPVRIPNFLLNGAEGIAVGMSTSVPTHNLGELCDTCIAYIEDRNISIPKLLHILKGPDFPTGGIIANKSELKNIYMTGSGKLKLRGKVVLEHGKRKSDKDKLVITEIPYTMVGSGIGKFFEDVASLIESKKLSDVTDISNQSDKNGIRIVLELKNGADPEKVKNILYKKTKLEDTYGVNMLAISGARPEVMDLSRVLYDYLEFQYICTTNKYTQLLSDAQGKKEVQEGLIAAYDCIDVIIAVLRGARTTAEAKDCLMTGNIKPIKFKTRDKIFEKDAKNFSFTDRQAQAILDMKLSKLIGLEIDALRKAYDETLKNIKEYEQILKSKKKMDTVIIDDLKRIKKEYAIPRKTLIEDGKEAIVEEEPIAEEEVVFVMDKFGYCKIVDQATYERNAETIETEYRYAISVWNTDKMCIFTDIGLMHQVKVMDIPSGKMRDKGIPIDNISKYDGSKEEILLVTSTGQMDGNDIVFVTRDGLVKKVPSDEFITNNRTVAATKLNDDDKVAGVVIAYNKKSDIVLATEGNYVLKFSLTEVNELKKTSKGIKGISLSKDDHVIAMSMTDDIGTIKVRGRDIAIGRLKLAHRAGKGSKIRV